MITLTLLQFNFLLFMIIDNVLLFDFSDKLPVYSN